ncbi:MAG: hypothetical protein SGPRY_002484 [Prymnesium sp.]
MYLHCEIAHPAEIGAPSCNRKVFETFRPHMLALLACALSHQPPLGATYSRTVQLPVIGEQSISLTILTPAKALLHMRGRLNLNDEPVEYTVDPSSGQLSFTLSQRTRSILRQFRTSLVAAGYDPQNDVASVTIWPPLPVSIPIRLQRDAVRSSPRQLKNERMSWERVPSLSGMLKWCGIERPRGEPATR